MRKMLEKCRGRATEGGRTKRQKEILKERENKSDARETETADRH